jgi:hypothetical protein
MPTLLRDVGMAQKQNAARSDHTGFSPASSIS